MARFSRPDWADELPWVLLGIRSAPKEDLQASAVEMVYGAPLSLLGAFSGPDPDTTATDKNLLLDLHRRLASLIPPPPAHHGTQPFHLSKELDLAQFIFLWRGPQGVLLQRPYEGPYKVLHQSGGTFNLDIGGPQGVLLQRPYEGPYKVLHQSGGTFNLDIVGREELFTVDRLKMVHLDLSQPIQMAGCQSDKTHSRFWGRGLCGGAHSHGELAPLVSPRGEAAMGKWRHQKFLSDSSIPSSTQPGQRL
ncbi:uncharacterized protein [Narcine bancroftii]|uniref:uncharacterized protein n=1 Tax=Narcine bancroftii TaxID=1343680 RepID=UPI003831531F